VRKQDGDTIFIVDSYRSLTIMLKPGLLTSLHIMVKLGQRLKQTILAYHAHPDLFLSQLLALQQISDLAGLLNKVVNR